MGGGDGGFDEHAGLLWLQRVRQYTLANGIAWVILNPYMGKPPRYRCYRFLLMTMMYCC